MITNPDHHELTKPEPEQLHRFDRWILQDGRTVTGRCTCSHEYSDGDRYRRGNPNEVLARIQQHIRDAALEHTTSTP